MNNSEKDLLVHAWIAHGLAEENSPEYESNFWAFEKFCDVVEEDPDLCWDLILEVLSANQSTPILEILSAGPLEDLLSEYGPRVIDRVESEAKRNPKFASLLGGVWKNTMSDEIWNRVQVVWDRQGWDDE
jgi:hypothetical protein